MAIVDAQAKEVTTIDVLKLVAIVSMIIDHVGLYLIDDPWLRIVGRPAAVIFGFLIGCSKTTRVPPSWIVLGLGLTLLEDGLFPDEDERALDVLIGLALARLVVPLFDRLHAVEPLLLAPIAIVLALVAEPLNRHVEYGSEVMLVALLGVAVRLHRGEPGQSAARDAVALIAILCMSLISIRNFELTGWQVVASTAVFALTICALAGFRRTTLSVPAPLAPLLHFAGRNTLWIYAAHLAALQVAGWWMEE